MLRMWQQEETRQWGACKGTHRAYPKSQVGDLHYNGVPHTAACLNCQVGVPTSARADCDDF